MAEDLARHDAVVSTCIQSAGGVVFTTAGDSFAAAFIDPTKAIEAAVNVQRSLASEAWLAGGIAVRCSINTGTAEERAGDYFGPTLNRTTRLLALGHGGQILVAAATRLLVEGEFIDLGEHRLKDVGGVTHVYQVVGFGLQEGFPPLRSLDVQPNNLPTSLSSFVGRTEEMPVVVELIATNRLTTITGAGGAGKTRLALEVAHDQVGRYPDGVWFVALGGLEEPGLIAGEVLESLRLSAPSDRMPEHSLIDQLSDRNLLVVLDDCERMVEAIASLVHKALVSAPALRILATSREALQVEGEGVWPLPALKAKGSAATSDAVKLFMERLPAGIEPASLDLELVKAVCERLDGLPLAIELAAARLQSLSLNDLEQRLDDRFRLLTGGTRSSLPHHRTLLATVEWSYDLLEDDSQRAYRMLSVLPGELHAAGSRSDSRGGRCASTRHDREPNGPVAALCRATRRIDRLSNAGDRASAWTWASAR